ncbi:MAG TPA: FlgD immunoglobulin-like domain containing protein, partial [Tepidisphaeraceae bacterium]|nr:FlgD immunoglobulin-like domain containing protein [Tepidisphaeraceae bacterium]
MVLLLSPRNVHANVYATNIRLNGGLTNIVASSGASLAISYILNEPATLGVSVNVNSGATTVRTITLTNPDPGTLQGSNYVVWDGRDNASNPVGGGVYSVSITAASSGYTNWTETSSELDDLDYRVWWPRGIAVNRNTNSPYYGRVFVANAQEGFDTITYPGDRVGITLHNADGSYADEWGYSTGGYDWAHGDTIQDQLSPWKLEVGSDDRLYANDFTDQGLVFSFDQLVSTNSFLAVLDSSNYPTNGFAELDGPFISGAGGTMQIWMADTTDGAGILRWNLTAGGVVAPNDTGVTIIQPNSADGLDVMPRDVALDSSNNIYVIQDTDSGSDWRVLRFPAYIDVTETNASWRIGSGDDSMRGAGGVAVDPTGTYVAVAFKGFFDSGVGGYQDGSLQVFAASNGDSIVTLAPGDDHYDTAWDNVGNLYAVDGFAKRWRSYSPPGTNQATTVAVPTVQISAPTQFVLSNPSYAGAAGQFVFTLTGEANATYIILASTDLSNWTPVATNTSALAARQITNTVSGSRSFFRARLG